MVSLEYFGSIFILISTWYQVQLDVKINEWFGDFYRILFKSTNNTKFCFRSRIYWISFTFAKIAGLWIIIAVFTGFFTSHWVFSGEHQWQTITMINGLKPD